MMCDLVDLVRHADEHLINDLIQALAQRFEEMSPDYELLIFSVEKKRSFNEQADEFIAFMQKLKKENI